MWSRSALPVIGGPKYTVFAKSFQNRGIDLDAMAAAIEIRNKTSMCTPVIAIYSRRDGIVAWKACIDNNGTNVEHIEVHTTHFGFGFSANMYKIIAQRLAGLTVASQTGPEPVVFVIKLGYRSFRKASHGTYADLVDTRRCF